jgi:hypothetical protein
MVDALRRAQRCLAPGGSLIDLHPSASPPAVEVGVADVGVVESAAAQRRHAAADAALAAVVAGGLFRVQHAIAFDFYTYGDSIEELRDYVAEEWRDSRIAADVVARARAALECAPGGRVRLRERVHAARYDVRRIDTAAARR